MPSDVPWLRKSIWDNACDISSILPSFKGLIDDLLVTPVNITLGKNRSVNGFEILTVCESNIVSFPMVHLIPMRWFWVSHPKFKSYGWIRQKNEDPWGFKYVGVGEGSQ